MSIFTELYDLRIFESIHAYTEFHRKLSIALEEGWVEEIPVAIKREHPRDERWFREGRSGEVYALEDLEGKPSSWRPVEPEDLFPNKFITPVSNLRN
jgi:hypothetical protein